MFIVMSPRFGFISTDQECDDYFLAYDGRTCGFPTIEAAKAAIESVKKNAPAANEFEIFWEDRKMIERLKIAPPHQSIARDDVRCAPDCEGCKFESMEQKKKRARDLLLGKKVEPMMNAVRKSKVKKITKITEHLSINLSKAQLISILQSHYPNIGKDAVIEAADGRTALDAEEFSIEWQNETESETEE